MRGYHVYKDVWAAVVGEELVCRIEKEENYHDVYAVSVMKDSHLPLKETVTCRFTACSF